MLKIQLVKNCLSGLKGSLYHSPSSFSSKTGLLEELLAPILFFHLPQWNIDDQIAFLASWRETTALCWTRSSNDRKHNHTSHPPQIKNIQAPLLRFIYPIFVRPTTRLKVLVNLVYRRNLSHIDWTVKYFTQRHAVVAVGGKMQTPDTSGQLSSGVCRLSQKTLSRLWVPSSVKLETVSVQETTKRRFS